MKAKHLIILPISLLALTILSGALLSSVIVSADDSVVDTLNVAVNTACTLSSSLGTTSGVTGTTDGDGNNTYTTTITPGSTKDINGSILSTICNDSAGYSLYAIGYSGDSYDSATHTKLIGTDANIDTGTSGPNSYWAMKLAAVTTPTPLTPPTILNDFDGYHVIPDTYAQIAKYTSATPSATSAGATIQTDYRISVSANQAPDTYTGKVKYTIVHPNDAPAPTPEPAKTYIQDLTLADCQSSASSDNLTVTDRRDENDYTVRYINGQCWMTQNLRITGTISATDSNFSGSDFNVSQYSLDSTDSSYANHCDSTNGYNYACAKDSGSETTGAWYNYYAATAGTISTNNNQTPATSDICPSGWHLPSGPNTTANTDINKLVGNTTSGWQDPTAGLTAFGAVAGGLYNNGSLLYTGYGYWWSATAFSATSRYILAYDSSNGQFFGNGGYGRYYGLFVRCVKSS